MNTTFHRTARIGFGFALSLGAMLAPLLLVLFVFATQDDAAAKAHLIVHGCESIVSALAAALLLRGAYLLGARKAPAFAAPLAVRVLEMA
jgi:hypothetical protein